MFKQLVMLVRGLMGRQSTAPSMLTAEQPSPSAKPLRAKRTPASPKTVRQPASKSAKHKPKAAQSTTPAKSRKPASKPAQTTSGKRGRPRKTAA
jgi:hypothetical protein